MNDRDERHAANIAFGEADDAWQAELVEAFGRQACERRYDLDQRDHPPACRAASAAREAARERWERACGMIPTTQEREEGHSCQMIPQRPNGGCLTGAPMRRDNRFT
jgi:hypothetical protein